MAGWRQQLDSAGERILGRRLTAHERVLFEKYLDLLTRWQRVHRLVGSADRDWIVRSLILDSLLFVHLIPESAQRVLDFGSGAGVPGVPVAIVSPALEVVLLESRQRRVSFLATVVRELALSHVRVQAERVRTARAELEGAFDAVLMRCAGRVSETAPMALALARPGGSVIISAPPEDRGPAVGRTIEVPGVEAGSRRRFVVVERST